MRWKRQQRTAASSSANSFRNLGGIPSGPEALSVFYGTKHLANFMSTDNDGGHIVVSDGQSGRARSIGITEKGISRKIRTKENGFIRRIKRYRTIRMNKWRKIGVTEAVKDFFFFFFFFLNKKQNYFSVEELSLSTFPLAERWTGSLNLSRTTIPSRYKSSISELRRSLIWLMHSFSIQDSRGAITIKPRIRKVIKEDAMHTLILVVMTSLTTVAVRSGLRVQKQ